MSSGQDGSISRSDREQNKTETVLVTVIDARVE